MNPVNELIAKLSPTKVKYGMIVSIDNDGLRIAVNGIVEKWPLTVGVSEGETVLIYEGRLIKSTAVKEVDWFEV